MAKAKSLGQQIIAYARLHRHLSVYASTSVIDFDAVAAVEYQALEHFKRRIGVYDLRIAAIAKSRDATLITRNARHSGLVPGLTIEDWTRPL
jgi:tRNA(fMet)-specific endonuclease VapC